MAVDFPNSPNTGDTHTEGGGVWKWNGYAWRRVPDPGAKGEPGVKGQKGEIGSTGSQGDKGEKGAASTVAGPQGQKGEAGEKGATGANGDKGAKGEPSTVPGDKGDKGEIGNTGSGTKGEKGAGSSVTIGTSPPTSPTPAPGDMWWDSDDADLHVYYNDGNSAQWVSVTSSAALKGQTGDKGQKGEIGVTGDKGQKGEAGAAASKGQKGEIGATGGSGGTGATGDKGQKGAEGSAGSTGIPSGFIGLWSGAANNIPSGWYLCDGNNGTPNLKDRFVIGAGNSYNVNDTGGSKDSTLVSHSHTINNHTHSFSGSQTHDHNYAFGQGSGGGIGNNYYSSGIANVTQRVFQHAELDQSGGPDGQRLSGYTADTQDVTVSISGNTGNPSNTGTNSQGSSSSNTNLPPYYALCYIMKS